MKKIFFIAIFFSFFGMQNIFAAAPQCPNFSEIKPTADEIVSKIDQCLEARANRTSNTIEDFQCPAGEFALEDRAELTNERLAYYIATNFFMNEADAKVKQYMQQLQHYRDKDPVAWTQAYGSCILGKGDETQKSLAYFYDTICQFSRISNFLDSNSQNRKFGISSDAYPQKICTLVAQKKKNAWMNLGNSLMQQGIYKSFENDRSYYMEGIQGNYRAILEKFHNYQKIVFRSASKITHYIRQAVK